MASTRRPRLTCGNCGIGCIGALVVAAGLFAVIYTRSGRYRPYIPPPQPLPVPNALDDYIAAGQMFRANGGMGPIYQAQDQIWQAQHPSPPGGMMSSGMMGTAAPLSGPLPDLA